MTWDQERELVLYKLDEMKKKQEMDLADMKREQLVDRELLHSINSKLIQYQSSVRVLKWVAATLGAAASLLLNFAWKFIHPSG